MMTSRTLRMTSTLALAVLLALLVAPAPLDAQATPPATAAATPGGDQPQMVQTSGGHFWTSIGYLLVTLLVGGSLYSVCRSSQRT